jgi:YHS domain-containing protein
MQVTDPVCGMQIESSKASARETVQGQTYSFCSSACHGQFRAEPNHYVKKEERGKRRGSERS